MLALEASPRPRAGGLLLASALLAAPLPVAATSIDGFFPARGQGDLVLSHTAERYDEFWMGDEKVADPGMGRVETRSESLWGRFGLTDDLAVIFAAPWVDAESNGSGGWCDRGFQDATALLSWRALGRQRAAGRHTVALGGGLRTPVESYDPNLPVDRGDGTTDVLLRAAYQLERGRFYLTQMVGYELRGGDAPDGVPFRTTFGVTLGRITTSASWAAYRAAGGSDIGEPGFTFPGNEDEHERIGLHLYARLAETWGLAAGTFTTLDGRNTGDAEGLSLGVVHRIR